MKKRTYLYSRSFGSLLRNISAISKERMKATSIWKSRLRSNAVNYLLDMLSGKIKRGGETFWPRAHWDQWTPSFSNKIDAEALAKCAAHLGDEDTDQLVGLSMSRSVRNCDQRALICLRNIHSVVKFVTAIKKWTPWLVQMRSECSHLSTRHPLWKKYAGHLETDQFLGSEVT